LQSLWVPAFQALSRLLATAVPFFSEL